MNPRIEWARALLESDGSVLNLASRPDQDAVTDWVESGVVALTGRRSGPPLIPPGLAASASIGAELTFGVLADRAGLPVPPRDWHRMLSERARFTGWRRQAPWSLGGTCRALRAADGWTVFNLARSEDVDLVPALVCGAAVKTSRQAWQAIARWLTRTTAAEAVARARLLGLPCGQLPPPGQWAGRDDLVAGFATSPVRTTAIADGQPPPRGRPPLVVDLSALWAGPLCANLLGQTGGRVIKVESTRRLDAARFGHRGFYNQLHRGHESVVVDFQSTAGRGLVAGLLERADIVIESSRPHALPSLGFDPVGVCRRSTTTWVGITAYGRTPDSADRVGFGDDVAMAAGLYASDVASGTPVPCGDAIADPLAGMHAAVAALSAYIRGGSSLLDVSMCDIAAATVAARPARPARAQTAIRHDNDGPSLTRCWRK